MLADMDRRADSVTAVVVGAGAGERLGAGQPKAFVRVRGRPMIVAAAQAAAASSAVDDVVVVVPDGMQSEARALLAEASVTATVVVGGATRQGSVRAALEAIDEEVDAIVVHDAARAFASPELFTTVVEAVRAGADAAVPALGITDTVKRVHEGVVVATLDRSELVAAQTPQAFRASALRQAHAEAASTTASMTATDDASMLEAVGYAVRVVPGEPGNVKITTAADLARFDGVDRA